MNLIMRSSEHNGFHFGYLSWALSAFEAFPSNSLDGSACTAPASVEDIDLGIVNSRVKVVLRHLFCSLQPENVIPTWKYQAYLELYEIDREHRDFAMLPRLFSYLAIQFIMSGSMSVWFC